MQLHLRASERLAIVGATESGKSTLAGLIAGLRLPPPGRVTLGCIPTADLATGTPDGRRRIMLVTQEHHLFPGTIADNLRLARRDASASDVDAALTAVGAAVWVDALPDGADTPVGTEGIDLTPRRIQQLALARVLLLDPQVVVMDEATAEGGSDTAQALDRAALAATEGRTGGRGRPSPVPGGHRRRRGGDGLRQGHRARATRRTTVGRWDLRPIVGRLVTRLRVTHITARPFHAPENRTRARQKRLWATGGNKAPKPSRRIEETGISAVRALRRPYRPRRPVRFVVPTASHSGRQTAGGNTAC